jgi:hypothetical protein
MSRLAILNMIAWILLASAGVFVSRYFDSVWPQYERRVIVDGSGAITDGKMQRKRRFSYLIVRTHFISHYRHEHTKNK